MEFKYISKMADKVRFVCFRLVHTRSKRKCKRQPKCSQGFTGVYKGLQGYFKVCKGLQGGIHGYTRVLLGIIIGYPGDYICTNINYMPVYKGFTRL